MAKKDSILPNPAHRRVEEVLRLPLIGRRAVSLMLVPLRVACTPLRQRQFPRHPNQYPRKHGSQVSGLEMGMHSQFPSLGDPGTPSDREHLPLPRPSKPIRTLAGTLLGA